MTDSTLAQAAAPSTDAPARGAAPIPFNRAAVMGKELEYIAQALHTGRTASGGPFTERASRILADEAGSADVLLTTSCTSALELSAMLLDLQPGDTVIVPSYTFSTTALAFARAGARILFADIEPLTLGIDPRSVAELLDDSVRAVVPVHYAGVACQIDELSTVLANRPDVAVIEDNAHGLFGRWKGQPLGSLGSLATLSFHETKNFTSGEGGALLVNDEKHVDRARVLYEKGTNRRAFFMGQVDKYSWMDTGSSFAMSDLLAAYLTGQLEQREQIQSTRRALYERYHQMLAPHADDLGFLLPFIPVGAESAYHMFYVLLPDRETRDHVLSAMRDQGVQATFHYVPLHSSQAGRRFSARDVECPVTDSISGRLLRLPFFNTLTDMEQERVVDTFLRAQS